MKRNPIQEILNRDFEHSRNSKKVCAHFIKLSKDLELKKEYIEELQDCYELAV